jgi:Ser/Thr protein kinase RdoA (MazF antagonist)
MSLLQRAPRFSVEAAEQIVRTHYALNASADPLPSERDQNFRVKTASGDEFVLKIANSADPIDFLRAQNAAMAHLADRRCCPRVIADIDGHDIATASDEHGTRYLARLVTWIPGMPLAAIESPGAPLLEDLGRLVGDVDRALASFDHPAIHRDFYWDLANGLRCVHERVPLVKDADLRVLAIEIAVRFERDVVARTRLLRSSAIHNDANDYNVIVNDGRVTGLVDFGDMVHGWMVGDLAIAIAYAVLGRSQPRAVAEAVRRGYEAVNPLRDVERALLYPLVRLRLAMSICIAAAQAAERPGDAYLTISQDPIRRTLPALMDLE